MKSLTDLIELIQKIKTPAPWVFAIFCIVFLDWYALQNIGLSITELLSEPTLIQKSLGQRWLLQLSICIVTFSFIWFIGLYFIVMPIFDWVIFQLSLLLPEFLQSTAKYRSNQEGFVPVRKARQYAIFHQNKLLLDCCDKKFKWVEERENFRRCCIGIALLGMMGWASSTSGHPSLFEHIFLWVDQMVRWKQFIFTVTSTILAAVAFPVIFSTNEPYDDYIYLPELANELKK